MDPSVRGSSLHFLYLFILYHTKIWFLPAFYARGRPFFVMTSHIVCVYTFYIFVCVWLVLLPHTERVVRSALCVVSLVPNWFNVQCNHTNEIWGTPLSLSSPSSFSFLPTHTLRPPLCSLSLERDFQFCFFHFLFFDFTGQLENFS